MAGEPVGLDFGAIMAVASAQDVDAELLADVLPEVETAILVGMSDQSAEE